MAHLKLISKLNYLLSDISQGRDVGEFPQLPDPTPSITDKTTALYMFCDRDKSYWIVKRDDDLHEVNHGRSRLCILLNTEKCSSSYLSDHPYSNLSLSEQKSNKYTYAEVLIEKVANERYFKNYPRKFLIPVKANAHEFLEETIKFFLHTPANDELFDLAARKYHLKLFAIQHCLNYQHFRDSNHLKIFKEHDGDTLTTSVIVDLQHTSWNPEKTWENTYAQVWIEAIPDTNRKDVDHHALYLNLSTTSQPVLTTWMMDVFQLYSKTDNAKRLAGYQAVNKFVENGNLVGLGTGSTAFFATQRVGQKLHFGLLKGITCIPTSQRTEEQARSLNIPLCTLNNFKQVTGKEKLDVAIDGADAVEPVRYALIKGGGGALLREKLIEKASEKFICIVDESKLQPTLGPSFALPVEIVPFGYLHTIQEILKVDSLDKCIPIIRRGDIANNKDEPTESIAKTENGNYIVDLKFPEDQYIITPHSTAAKLKQIVGVVEHGLFCEMVSCIIVAQNNGTCVQYGGEGGKRTW